MTFGRLAAVLAAVSLLFGCGEKKSEPSSSEESSAVSEEVTEAETEAETDPELQGVKRLNVFTWMEEMNISLPMDGMGITPEDLQSGE